jgi:hypothetical protein
MKYTYIFLILLVQTFSFAQDPKLFENNWFLTNLIIDGSENLPPLNTIDLTFNEQTSIVTTSGTNCNELFGEVLFTENNFSNFSLTNWSYTNLFCPEINYYENLYFSFFTQSSFNNQYTYSITELNNVRTLTVNSMFNKQAIYSSQMLSNIEYSTFDFSIYPNPASEFINFSFNNQSFENAQIEIYDNLGRLCKTKILKSNQEKIDIQNLTSGIYLIKLETKTGIIIKKINKL